MPSLQTPPADWLVPTPPSPAESLAHELGCPVAIACLLLARNLDTPALADQYLNPTLTQLHDPHLLLGIPAAVTRIQQAVHHSEPILIYGDYDVDGTTATVLLKTAIERIAPRDTPAIVRFHVPHRIREGYGMQAAVLGDAALTGIRLVISVDTGIRAFAAADEARALGLDLIVTDHHLPDDIVGTPDALAVINPAQTACPYPNKNLCGAGVAFKLAHALLLVHADQQPDPTAARARLDQAIIPSFLKLVAIATVADAVPLTGENRAIAILGLRELANPVQPGLRALLEVAKIPADRAPTATEVGFRLGPRINAAGRMDHASDVVELFLTRDPHRARELAEKLDHLNEDRRATEAHALDAIEKQLAQQLADRLATGGQHPGCIVLDDPDWHRGVLGILASRVVDRTGRPALVLTHHDGQAHGSGRSIPGFHLLDALTAVHTSNDNGAAYPTRGISAASDTDTVTNPSTHPQNPGAPGPSHLGTWDNSAISPAASSTPLEHRPIPLFTRFGGHAHAVGFSLPSGHVPLLRERMQHFSATHLTEDLLLPPLECDAELHFRDLTINLCHWLARLEPYGNGNPEPIFLARGLTLAAPMRLIKEKHICLELTHPHHTGRISALGWSRSNVSWPTRIADLAITSGSMIDAAFRLREKTNPYYPGIEMELVDLRLTNSPESSI